MKHKHLTLQDRYYIEISLRNGDTQTAIAKSLGTTQGTISKEIKRNRGAKGYRHKQAHRLATQREQDKPKAIKLTDDIIEFIKEELITHQSSPEQITGRLERVHNISLHHETIYRYILQDKRDEGELYLHLRHK